MSGVIVLVIRILLAMALYAFLGWAMWTIWVDLKRTGLKAGTNKVRVLQLEVKINDQPVVNRSFSKPEVTLGRDPACDIFIDDGAVSARHARLSFHLSQWWIEDLASTNGTNLNNEKLTIATVLTSGDEIKCGQARLAVNLGSDSLRTQLVKTEVGHD
jgi:pSer/pThr/pTyr-binding forkhead associated (FHA) protein